MTVMLGCTPREGDPQGGAEGGFLFGYFLLAAQEKVTCARGSPPRIKLIIAKRHK